MLITPLASHVECACERGRAAGLQTQFVAMASFAVSAEVAFSYDGGTQLIAAAARGRAMVRSNGFARRSKQPILTTGLLLCGTQRF